MTEIDCVEFRIPVRYNRVLWTRHWDSTTVLQTINIVESQFVVLFTQDLITSTGVPLSFIEILFSTPYELTTL